MPHDVEPVLECARNLQGSRIPLKCARWNAECVTVHALQPVGIGGTHAGQSEEEQRRPDGAAEEPRYSPAVRRPWIHRGCQDQPPEPFVWKLGAEGSEHHGHSSAMRGAQKVESRDSCLVQKAEKTLCYRPETAVHLGGTVG